MPGRTYLGLCAIAKDEDSIVREWVAYHHAIGFERIFIYDNGSQTPVRDLVADFYDQGIVETYTMPGKGMQLTAYNHFLHHHGAEFVWTAFFDLDEFLLLPELPDARILLAGYEEYPCLSINWGDFTSSGHLKRPAGLVIESFQELAVEDVNTKCIVQPRHVKMPLSPHHFIFKDPAEISTPPAEPFFSYAVNTRREPAVGAYVPTATKEARLNHYRFRSQQDYEERLMRGDAVYAENPRSLNDFYWQAGRPVVTDAQMDRHVERVRQIMLSGKSNPYCPVESMSLSAGSLTAVLQKMVTALRKGRPDVAFTMFCTTLRIFRRNEDFLRMGIRLALMCKLFSRAESLARELIRLAPDLAAYQQLLAVQLAQGDRPAAESTAAYITATAHHIKDTAIGDAVREMMQQ